MTYQLDAETELVIDELAAELQEAIPAVEDSIALIGPWYCKHDSEWTDWYHKEVGCELLH